MIYVDNKMKIAGAIIALIVLAIIAVINPEVSSTLDTQGKILPAKQFLIRTNGSGSIESLLVDNIVGQVENYSVFNFQRGDVIDFNPELKQGTISRGDTLVRLLSNRFIESLDQIALEISEIESMLAVSSAGRKPEVEEEMRQRVVYAEQKIATQNDIFERAKLLLEKQIISQQDFEVEKGKLELYKIELSISKQMLASAEAGSKPEQISALRKQLSVARNLSNVLRTKMSRLNIISPINGIPLRYANNDTLVTVNSVEDFVITMPVLYDDLSNVKLHSNIYFKIPGSDSTINAEITGIDKNIFFVSGVKYFRVYSNINLPRNLFAAGALVLCTIETEKMGLLQYLDRIIK